MTPKAYEKIRMLFKTNPNAPEMRTALRHFDSKVLLRELQRRNAMPPMPKLEADGIVIEPSQILGWTDDDSIRQECERRDIWVANPDAVMDIAYGINNKTWDQVKEGYAKL